MTDSIKTSSQPSAGGHIGEVRSNIGAERKKLTRAETIQALEKWAAEIRRQGYLTAHEDAELLECAAAWLKEAHG